MGKTDVRAGRPCKMRLVRLSAEGERRGGDVIHCQFVLSHGPSFCLRTLRVVFRQTGDERSSHGFCSDKLHGHVFERVGGGDGVFVVGRRHDMNE